MARQHKNIARQPKNHGITATPAPWRCCTLVGMFYPSSAKPKFFTIMSLPLSRSSPPMHCSLYGASPFRSGATNLLVILALRQPRGDTPCSTKRARISILDIFGSPPAGRRLALAGRRLTLNAVARGRYVNPAWHLRRPAEFHFLRRRLLQGRAGKSHCGCSGDP